MEYKLLESNGIEHSFIDGAAFNNIAVGACNGVLKGVLNECRVYQPSSNIIEISTGELIIQGFRVKLLSPYSAALTAEIPSRKYHIVARISVTSDKASSFQIVYRDLISLLQEPIHKTEQGTYEIELAQFVNTVDGIQQVKRTVMTIGNDYKQDTQDALNASYQALEASKSAHSISTINSKRLDNVESVLSKDRFIVDSAATYKKSVPANVAPYAEIISIGGMTYKSINLISPQKMLEASSDTTLNEDVFTTNFNSGTLYLNRDKTIKFPAGNYSITIQPVSNVFSAVIYIYATDDGSTIDSFYSMENTSSAPFYKTFSVAKEFVLCIGGLYSEDGKYYGTYSYKVLLAHGSKEYAYFPYFEGLYHAKVKALKSKGANLFDIDKFLSLKGNSTYYSKNENNELIVIGYDTRANADVESIMTLSAGTYYVQFDRETVGTVPYEVFITGTNTGLVSSSNPYYFTLTEETPISMKFVKQTTANYGNVQVHRGTTSQTFYPYSAEPIDTFTIPEAVQALEGYGLGVNENYYNYIEYANGRVILTKRAKEFVITQLGYVAWASEGYSNVDYYAFKLPTDYIGYATDAFMLGGVKEKPTHSNWDSTDFVGVATGKATEFEIWVGFAKGTNQTEAETALIGKKVVYALAKPETTDITDLMPIDNFVKVQSGGSIIPVNEYEYAAPTTITYQKRS